VHKEAQIKKNNETYLKSGQGFQLDVLYKATCASPWFRLSTTHSI